MAKNLLLHTLTQIALNERITELKYKDVIITLVDSYGELNWVSDYYGLSDRIYDETFKTWVKRMRRYGYDHELKKGDYEYDVVKRGVLYNDTRDFEHLKQYYALVKYYPDIKRAFEAQVKKSPLDDTWIIKQLETKIPWASIPAIAEHVAGSLNDYFLPIAQVVGLYKSYIADSDIVHVGHYKGYPIIWKYKYTWSRKTVALLETITVTLDRDRFVVSAGSAGSWYIRSLAELEAMTKELKHKLIKLWLESSDARLSVLSLCEQGVMRDEDYDSHIYNLKSGDPGFFNLGETKEVREDTAYIDLYIDAEENLKKEENNG